MAVRPARHASARAARPARRKTDTLSILSEKALLIAGLAAVACFGYLLWGLMSQSMLYFPYLDAAGKLLTAEQQTHMLTVVDSVCRWFAVALLLAMLAAVGRFYQERAAAWVVLLIGGALYFGFPFLLGTLLQQYHLDHNALTRQLMANITSTAKGVLAASVLWLVVLVVVHLVRRPRDRWTAVTVKTEAAGRPRASLMRQCWELSHCSANTRGICKCYSQRHSCWKTGAGCFCDSSMFDRMTDGVGTWVTLETKEVHTRALGLRRMGRKACKVCPLYEEHQYYKYRTICWVAYPAAVALIVAGFPALGTLFSASMVKLDRFVAGLSLLGDKPAGDLFASTANTPVQWFMMACLAFLLLGYLLQLLEWLIFEKKL